MKVRNYKMTKEEIIITVVGAIFSSGLINIIITHILYNSKLKKEFKYKGNDMLAKDIENSLQFVRNIELEIMKQEVYSFDNIIKQKMQINVFNPDCIYPEIFNDWDSYISFMDKIQEIRKVHEKNLPCKIALNIVFIDRYIKQLSLFMSDNGGETMLPFWGTIFIYDLQKWGIKVDRLLVKEINKYIYKLESHNGIKWKLERLKELDRQYKGTILYYLINGKCKRRDRKRMKCIQTCLEVLTK